MKNKYIGFVCFLIPLLFPVVGSSQSTTASDPASREIKSKQPQSLFNTYVRPRRPLYKVAASSTSTSPETPKAGGSKEKEEGKAKEEVKTGTAAEAKSTAEVKPGAASKADVTPSAAAIMEELEELKARMSEFDTMKTRIAELEKGLEDANSTAAAAEASASAARAQADKVSIPEGLQEPPPGPKVDNDTPYAFGDFTWLNGSPRTHAPVFDTKFFTPEVRFDTNFVVDFNQPRDHSLGGSTEEFRSGEVQVEQISVGGDFHWNNVRGRILTMMGLFATTTPRNDPSAGNGQWDVRNAYRYVSEAWGGYHFDVNHGLNVDGGIFVSYIGLFSYYNFDNWVYQPSFVSSNTPWFFNGIRIQWFPTNKLKIEPWIINGWQSYNKSNGHLGFGGQILYQPTEWLKLVLNNYGNGEDDLGVPGRSRIHTDNSIEVRYYNNPKSSGITKMAFSLTGDLGCEYGAGTACRHPKPYDPVTRKGGPIQAFAGWMAYDRVWFGHEKYAITYGGGQMNNPGRYLTLLPPINGADAISGTPYFPEGTGSVAHMWDNQLNLQWMPKENITWWVEAGYRHSDVPYWTGRGGITPPGGNNGAPSQFACMTGAPSGATDLPTAIANCGGPGSVWFPDLRLSQTTLGAGFMVKF
jgi:Putative beta-barrel porin-2, OmpL-like. bbp2